MWQRYNKAFNYIEKHKEIRDVIISGGDALMLSDEKLEEVIARVRKISHVEIIRVASRTPCVMPQRITDALVNMLKKYQPIYFMTHFNHPYEITDAAKTACEKITDAGIPLFNQSVLLRKINSDPMIMKKLMHKLLKIRVKPYYIYQCDPAQGIEHFRTPVAKGIEIMEYLRGHTSGLALPTLVLDAPGGGGKIPIMPNYLLTMTVDAAVVRNYRGMMSVYINPLNVDCSCSTTEKIERGLTKESPKDRVFLDMLEGKRVMLEPKI